MYRYGTQQAKFIVKKAFSRVHWYSNLIKELSDLRILKGAPQWWQKIFVAPEVELSETLRNQNDFCNRRFHLVDQEHLMSVKLYLQENGGWIPMAVEGDSSCLFQSIRRGLNIPKEYTARLFRHELGVFCAMNARILMEQHPYVLQEEYAKFADDNPGPLSIKSYLLHILKSKSWGDSICIDIISRLWGLKITVLDVEKKNFTGKRYRHTCNMDKADVVILFANKHYSAAVKMSGDNKEVFNGVPVRGIEDAPGLTVDDIPDEEESDKSVEPCDPFHPVWSVGEELIREQKLVSIPEDVYKSLMAVLQD